MSKPNPLPSLERLNEVFVYNADIGELSWRNPGRGRPVGRAGCVCPTRGYVKVTVDYKIYTAHRLMWKMATGKDPSFEIDHINGIKTDNRLCNLREATRFENNWNRAKKSSSPHAFKGVTQSVRSKKWIAQIRHNERKLHLGCFDTPEQAHQAYWKKAQELHGEFARKE